MGINAVPDLFGLRIVEPLAYFGDVMLRSSELRLTEIREAISAQFYEAFSKRVRDEFSACAHWGVAVLIWNLPLFNSVASSVSVRHRMSGARETSLKKRSMSEKSWMSLV